MIGPEVLDAARTALLEMLVIALPILGAGLLVGLLVSLAQAVTQVQEQSLTFLPKIVVMVVVAVLLLGWIAGRLVEFSTAMFASPVGGF